MQTFVDVILPLPVGNSFTYRVPRGMDEALQIGLRVVVPLGRSKYYTGIVCKIHENAPEGCAVKDLLALLDESPLVLPSQLKLWNWLADYYLCTLGDVYKAALPSGLKLESETIVTLSSDRDVEASLTEREQHVLGVLTAGKPLAVAELSRQTAVKNILPLVKSLLEKGQLCLKEQLKNAYKPRMETRVRLTEAARNERRLHFFFDDLQRHAPKQLDVLMKYMELSAAMSPAVPLREVSRAELLQRAGASPAALDALLKKGVLEQYRISVSRLADAVSSAPVELNPLSAEQQQAYAEIHHVFARRDVCLLYGVTASGKTEIYIHLIQEALQQHRQVLYLLPEIALTTQITTRLRNVFGARLGVYHSKFPDAERVEIWQRQLSADDYDIILGVRSSVFLPFRRLRLVIVDEEHETTYKQQEPAPRYHARNAAIMLAREMGAKVLLGTATPSLESWYNATQGGKYGLVTLTHRYAQVQLPQIVPVDVQELRRKKRMNGPFSPQLLALMRESLERGAQVILFQNRRGFAPLIECHACGWVPRCHHCDVSLTYHRVRQRLVCHYCGYEAEVPLRCPACGSPHLRPVGFGTERVEDDIHALFPQARVARMDLDTVHTRAAYERIISDFEKQQTDILIGTQMVSKGLDFARVDVVGILNADVMMNYPDFRAYERSFQLMAQVAGRAGRRDGQGKVVLQTGSVDHPLIAQVIANDYEAMARQQLAERQAFGYPPYRRMIYVYLKYRDEKLLDDAAHVLAQLLKAPLGERVLGPDRPPVSRVQSMFIRKIVLKVENSVPVAAMRQLLRQVRQQMSDDVRYRGVTVYFDVDPL